MILHSTASRHGVRGVQLVSVRQLRRGSDGIAFGAGGARLLAGAASCGDGRVPASSPRSSSRSNGEYDDCSPLIASAARRWTPSPGGGNDLVFHTVRRHSNRPAASSRDEHDDDKTSDDASAAPSSFLGDLLQRGAETGARVQATLSERSTAMQHGISDTLSSLRVRAALSLTSSLPPDDREYLLRSVGAVDERAAEEGTRRSIGEAVAKAVAEEAARGKAKEEEVRERAERAATERVKGELLVQARRLEDEKRRLHQQRRPEDVAMGDDVDGMEGSSELGEEAAADHPVLGPPIVDLGYKRVHIVSGEALAAVPVWERQRTYRHDRARSMAADKLRSGMHTGLPGIISLHEDKDGHLSIIDGQHRVGMVTILREKQQQFRASARNGDVGTNGGLDHDILGGVVDLDRILVEVFPHPPTSTSTSPSQNDTDHARDVFTEINKAEPVKLVDMPGVGATKTDARIINEAAAILQRSHPEMFKPSQRCRAPHVNVDNLRDALFAADVLNRHGVKRARDLVGWIEDRNAELAKKYTGEAMLSGVGGGAQMSPSGRRVSAAALAKATKHNFFLGLDSSWLYQ